MELSDQKIEWLTKDENRVFDYFNELMSFPGTFKRSKRAIVTSMIFWSLLYIPMLCVLLITAYHYIDDFDLLAYTLHHIICLSAAYLVQIVIVPLYSQKYDYVMDGSLTTFDYDSDLVNNYAKKIIRKRIQLSRLVVKLIYIGSIGIIFEVQLFFVMEAMWFKTYKTVFPAYIGLDLDDPYVFVPVVVWQELIVYYTTYLPVILSVVCYTAWSHLDLEIKIFTFTITNVQNIVQEKLGKPLSENNEGPKVSKMYDTYCHHFARHHASIIRYFDAFSQAVSWIITLLFSMGFLLFVTVGLSMMSDNLGVKLKLFWFLVLQLLVTYVWCLVGQDLSDKSEEISQVVACAPWWLMPKSSKTTLLLTMTRCMKPLKLTTVFGSEVNMENFMNMLKSVYQVVNLIYQMKNE